MHRPRYCGLSLAGGNCPSCDVTILLKTRLHRVHTLDGVPRVPWMLGHRPGCKSNSIFVKFGVDPRSSERGSQTATPTCISPLVGGWTEAMDSSIDFSSHNHRVTFAVTVEVVQPRMNHVKVSQASERRGFWPPPATHSIGRSSR